MEKRDEVNAVNSPVLMGWKDIARYLNMGVRTIQRYECELELPIRRTGGTKGAVIATRTELDKWLAARPKRELSSPTRQSTLTVDSRWEALQAGLLRMRELRKEMAQRRAELRAALSLLHGSIRVDAASFNLLANMQARTGATQDATTSFHPFEGTGRKAG